jgi:hypothetical protein
MRSRQRYANQVLTEQQTSLTRLIQTRRRARGRYAHEDPTQANRTASEISYSWGFTDMTQPSDYQVLAERSGVAARTATVGHGNTIRDR